MAKKKPRITRPPDPDADWNEPDPDPDEALRIADAILTDLKEAPAEKWDVAFEYFSRVKQSVSSVAETVRHTKTVTKNQLEALRGWQRGINKWLGKE